MRRVLMFILVVFVLVAPASAVEKSTDLTLAQVQAERRAIVEATVAPVPTQTDEFWQTYWEYRGHVGVLNDRVVEVINKFEATGGELRGDKAAAVVNEVLDIEKSRAALREQYVKKFKKILVPKQVVRWYQTERKMDAVIRAEIAATVPFAAASKLPSTGLTRTVIKNDREELVKAAVQPTSKQERSFWYQYRIYSKKIVKLEERIGKLIDEYAASYGSLSDDQAERMSKESADIETDRVAALETCVRGLAPTLVPSQMVRFLQLEQKMDAVVGLALAIEIPIER